MKKIIFSVLGILMPFAFSVCAFAGAPGLDELPGYVSTGGDFKIWVIIAIVAAVLAVVVGALMLFGGKKKR